MPFREVQPGALWDRASLPYQRADGETRVEMLDDPRTPVAEAPRSGTAMWKRARAPGFRRKVLVGLLSASIGAGGMYAAEHGPSWYAPASDPLAVSVDTGALVAARVISRTPLVPVTLTYLGATPVRIASVRYSSSDGQFAWWGNGQSLVPGKTVQMWGYVQLSCGDDLGPGDGTWAEIFTSTGSDRLLRLRATDSALGGDLHRACP